MLAWLSAMEANFLVLDEPTNHLDLWSRHALEQALADFDGTVLLVTHDRFLVNAVADHVLVLSDGRASRIVGNYDTYRHWIKQGLAIEDRGSVGRTALNRQPGASGAASGPDGNKSSAASHRAEQASLAIENRKGEAAQSNKRKRKFPYRKVHQLEQDIAAAESLIEQFHQQMLDPDVLRDGRKIKQLQEELTTQEQRLLQLYEHYEEACELN
jgi:ATP-binding cassette, subfamily F, member 3